MERKNKITLVKKIKKNQKANAQHWIQSRARLTKILEASGMKPEPCVTMLPRDRDR